MKKNLFLITVAVLISLLHSAQMTIRDFEQQIWVLTNQQRAKYHLPLLKYDDGLADLARVHSKNMLNYGFFNHKDQIGDMVADRHRKFYSTFVVSSIGENLARFTNSEKVFSPQEIVEGWMNSPDHRKNMLDDDYTHLGVGVISYEGKLLATQNFATAIVKLTSPLPKSFCPTTKHRLEFKFLSPRPWQTFSGIMKFPNSKFRYKLDKNRYSVGSKPLQINWIDEDTFYLELEFPAGKGTYSLNFGFYGSYFEDGIRLRVR